MSDYSKDYDEFKCKICGKIYHATCDRDYCNDCARIVYRKYQGRLFPEREVKNENKS